ncbi:hypothetical protein [Rudanella lutea]|uniref:hypothetical protein n=1 Tax=Rudanella lutea TaxID=451374 RepID=UPI000371B4C9|nr:hypothetical protein [Rudanella lutea]
MNLFDLSKHYWKLHEQQAFMPTDTHLYWCLINVFNARGNKGTWPESVTLTDGMFSGMAGLNRKTLWASRERLEARGLIVVSSCGMGKRNGVEYRLTCPKACPKNGQVNGQVYAQPVQQPVQKTDKLSDNSLIYIESRLETPDEGNDVDDAHEADVFIPAAVLAHRQTAFEERKKTKAPPDSARPPQPDPAEGLAGYRARITADRTWLEAAQLGFKISSERLSELLDGFTIEQMGFEKIHADYADYRKHAHFWIRKKLDHATHPQPNTRRNGRQQRPGENLGEFSREVDELLANWDN